MSYAIPFHVPTLHGEELTRVAEAFARRKLSGDGTFCRQAEKLLEEITTAKRALVTTSCTHALEASALLLDIAPGDEVILPSFTFVSTANAFALRGAKLVFCDVTEDTLNIDPAIVASLVTKKTKAIVCVHYAGIGCEMDALTAITQRHDVALIEDNAHGLFGSYRGKALGSFGAIATLSFHETKNIQCGEGGALLLNDPELIERTEILREKGTNRSRFFRGQVDKYTWVDLGSSWVLSEILAAVLVSQLEARDAEQKARKTIWTRYETELRGWAEKHDVRMPVVPAHCDQAYHLFHLRHASLARRTAFIDHMKEHGVQTVFHYVPLHSSPMGQKLGGRDHACPVTDRESESLVRLPLYSGLTEDAQAKVIAAALTFE